MLKFPDAPVFLDRE